MNNSIKNIAAQAGMAFANRDHNDDGVDLEKFAHLLIRECAIIANRAENNDSEFRSMYEVVTDYFGVK